MLGKLLSSIGIGAATVDTILDPPHAPLGGRLSGTVRVRGGQVEQDVSAIDLQLVTALVKEVDGKKVPGTGVVATARAGSAFRINPGESKELPFQMEVPLHTPVTAPGGRPPTRLLTSLAVAAALDPSDADPVEVDPAQVQIDTHNAMLALGFRLYKLDVEHRPRWHGGAGFVQEWEFRPDRGGWRYDEVEIVFQPSGGGFELLIQLDRAARGLGGLLLEAAGMDESWRRIQLPGGLKGPGQAAIERQLAALMQG